jgi:hypothetical protein
MMMMIGMDTHEQYLKLSMRKYLSNESQNEMNIVDFYLLLKFELMMMVVLLLIHLPVMMIEVYAIDDVKLNWQDN